MSLPGNTYTYAVRIETAQWGGGWHAHLVGQFSEWTEPPSATEEEAISVIQGKLTNAGVTLLPIDSVQPAKREDLVRHPRSGDPTPAPDTGEPG